MERGRFVRKREKRKLLTVVGGRSVYWRVFSLFFILLFSSILVSGITCDTLDAGWSCSGSLVDSTTAASAAACLTACEQILSGAITCCGWNDKTDLCVGTDGSRGVDLLFYSAGDCTSFSCSDVATSDVFKVQDSSGREFMRVDTNGDIAFSSILLTGETSISEMTNNFLIDNVVTGNYNFQLAPDIGYFDEVAIRGSVYEEQSSISYTSSQNFIIKTGSTTVLKIDPNGNLYTTGNYAEWCACDAGTYSDPRDLAGNRLLHYVSWGTDYKYADGYCQIVRGCWEATSVSTSADSSNSCRCDKGYGCSGESCTTATGSWTRFTSITCA